MLTDLVDDRGEVVFLRCRGRPFVEVEVGLLRRRLALFRLRNRRDELGAAALVLDQLSSGLPVLVEFPMMVWVLVGRVDDRSLEEGVFSHRVLSDALSVASRFGGLSPARTRIAGLYEMRMTARVIRPTFATSDHHHSEGACTRPHARLAFVLLFGPDRVRTTRAYPLIDFGDLEFPEPADPMCRQAAALDPSINRVLRDAEMSGDIVDRRPRFHHLRFVFCLGQRLSFGSLQERTRIGKSRSRSD